MAVGFGILEGNAGAGYFAQRRFREQDSTPLTSRDISA